MERSYEYVRTDRNLEFSVLPVFAMMFTVISHSEVIFATYGLLQIIL